MVLVPVRVATLVRSSLSTSTSPGLMAAASLASAIFTATPLVLGSVAERFDVSVPTAGLFSATQLGAFVVGSWLAPRRLRPSVAAFRSVVLVVAVANLISVFAPVFGVFVASRGFAGLALGVMTWMAWSQVFGDPDSQGDLTVVGPLSGVVFAPAIGVILEFGDDRTVYGCLAVAALLVAAVPVGFDRPVVAAGARHRPTRQAVILIVALGCLTLGGSAVFIYAGVFLGDDLGLSPALVSLTFSVNAMARIPSAPWRGRRPYAGMWLLVTASCAWGFTVSPSAGVAVVVLALWGFSFQAGVPGVFTLLSARSHHPTERAGDAQAVMALGRAIGPAFGGAMLSIGAYPTLGFAGGLIMGWAGLAALAVERRPAVAAAG